MIKIPELNGNTGAIYTYVRWLLLPWALWASSVLWTIDNELAVLQTETRMRTETVEEHLQTLDTNLDQIEDTIEALHPRSN